jgi:hypothetical protein
MEWLSATTELLKALADFAWPATLIGFVWFFRQALLGVLVALKNQISQGASLKYGDIELNGVVLSDFPLVDSSFYSVEPVDDELLEKRSQNYEDSKNIFLVHRVRKTDRFHETMELPFFDISVYLVGHKQYGSLNDVKLVEYYFGKFFKEDGTHRNGTKYIVRNSKNGFAVRTSAYGPTLCEVRVEFQDGKSTYMSRYVDFEGTDYKFDMQPTANPDGRRR